MILFFMIMTKIQQRMHGFLQPLEQVFLLEVTLLRMVTPYLIDLLMVFINQPMQEHLLLELTLLQMEVI